jgi:hypothetical protein
MPFQANGPVLKKVSRQLGAKRKAIQKFRYADQRGSSGTGRRSARIAAPTTTACPIAGKAFMTSMIQATSLSAIVMSGERSGR